MMYHILQAYFLILLAIGSLALIMLGMGLYFIFRPKAGILQAKISEPIPNEDFTAIAGDDLTETQLDLARAFIETDNSADAIAILEKITHHGTLTDKQKANVLLAQIATSNS